MEIHTTFDQLGDVVFQLVTRGLTFTAQTFDDGSVLIKLTGGY